MAKAERLRATPKFIPIVLTIEKPEELSVLQTALFQYRKANNILSTAGKMPNTDGLIEALAPFSPTHSG